MLKAISKYFHIAVLIICFLGAFPIIAQENEKIPLKDWLEIVEEKFNIRFSYASDAVENIEISPLNQSETLQQTLQYISEKTQLAFEKLNDRYFSITQNTNSNTQLCAQIIDANSGLPMENVTITLADGNYNTITNAEGFFNVPNAASNQSIIISHIGYSGITVPYSELTPNCPTLTLQTTVSELNEVLVSAILVKGINQNTDGSITLNTKNFGLLPGQVENDVLQMAQNIPGVESTNETISTLNVRGGTNDENLVLWEDIKMYQTGHFFGLISAFNPNITNQLTIYKNGAPPWYGESVSGIIDMRSSNEIAKDFHGGIGGNLINANAFVDVPLSEKASVQISGRSSVNFLLKTPVYTNYSERIFQNSEITSLSNTTSNSQIEAEEHFNFFDASAKLLWQVTTKDKLRFVGLGVDNDLDYTETITTSNFSELSTLNQKSLAGGLGWEHIWNSSFSTDAFAYASYYLLDALNRDIFSEQRFIQENEVFETGLKLNSNLKVSETVSWQNGYHFSEVGIANTRDVNLPRFRDFQKDVLRSHILFSHIKYASFNKKTHINIGLRGNYFEKFSEFIIEPRLNIVQKVGGGFSLEAAGEFKNQTTTQRIDFESDFLGVEKRRWVLANNETVPIKKSKQASAGIVYNNNGWLISAEGFYKFVEGITSKSQGFQNQFEFSQTSGDYTVSGLELLLNKKINRFSGWIAYTYKKNEYTFPDLLPTNFPNNRDIPHSLMVAGSYTWKKLKLSLGTHWRSGKPYTIPLFEGETSQNEDLVIDYDTPNAERLEDYFRTDFSAEYTLGLTKKLDAKVNLAVLNVTNKENILNIRYSLAENEDGEIGITEIHETSLGITPNLSVQILF